jgi:DNA repair protein RAD50
MDSCQRTVTQQRTRINQLEAELNKLTNRKLEIEGEQQRRTVTEAKREELEARVVRCGEAVSQSEAELGPARAELEAAEDRRKTVRRDGDRAIDANREKERRLEGLRGDIERLETAVRTYIQDGKDASLRTSKREKVELESKLGEMRAGRADLESRISDLRVRVSGQDGRRRIFDDNLKLREYKRQENRHAGEVAVQRAALEDRDWGRVERKKNELNRKYNELNAEMNAMGGQQAEVERTVREMEKELNQKKLKDAAKLFKEMTVSHNLRTKVASDLNKYYIALDFAIMKYHREKMKVVNKIIRELWLQVYRGNDIDYIEIKTDDADSVQSGADKKKTYSYRVVMVKNDTEMDMRARCSAGQKVLASLIIRLALAETFSTNCGIIALDEPTTNLDTANSESFAMALNEVIRGRKQQSNFQLIVITHDENFVQQVGRSENATHYFRVDKVFEDGDAPRSTIEKLPIDRFG